MAAHTIQRHPSFLPAALYIFAVAFVVMYLLGIYYCVTGQRSEPVSLLATGLVFFIGFGGFAIYAARQADEQRRLRMAVGLMSVITAFLALGSILVIALPRTEPLPAEWPTSMDVVGMVVYLSSIIIMWIAIAMEYKRLHRVSRVDQ